MDIQHYDYRISYREWLAGIRLARRRNLLWMLRFALGWLIPSFLFYLLLALLWNAIRERAPLGNALNGGIVIALLLAIILGYRVFRLRRSYRQSAMALHEEGVALAFNEEYFVSRLPNRSEGRFLWPALYDFAENNRVAIVYTAKNRCIVIPKHAMPPEAWNVFRTLVPQRRKQP